MKHLPNIAGGLLGLAFIAFSLIYLIKFRNMPSPPGDSPAAHFSAAFGPTGYMDLVKVCELIGGILCAIPLTRNIGLLFLGPVIINILAFHALVAKDGIFSPPLMLISLLALYLLWAARGKFTALLNR
jgi:putative oxidoreductase